MTIEPMHQWATELWPICRSLTGDGVRATISYLQKLMPGLEPKSVPTGYQAFDWTVPKEWTIRDAYISDLSGRKIVDFKNHNLHVMGYSSPVDQVIGRDDLNNHLYSLPGQPDAIPYVTSYYKERWGFCITERQRDMLTDDAYRVFIDSELLDGKLDYAELLIPGKSDEEILISTYICHPSMANNELSGPVVTAALARWIIKQPRHYSYRIVFIPETIGSVVYLSKNLEAMKRRTVAGFVVTCVGDERAWSFMPSRNGATLADRVARHVLSDRPYDAYSFLERGSDERQYCSPTVDLPVVSIMRSKYGTYPEYHTSLDDLNLVTQNGLNGSLETLKECLHVLENNISWVSQTHGEPQLGKRGLYPTLSRTGSADDEVRTMMNFLAYCDGKKDLIEIAETIGVRATDCIPLAEKFAAHHLITQTPT